jgi:hypothetical protein
MPDVCIVLGWVRSPHLGGFVSGGPLVPRQRSRKLCYGEHSGRVCVSGGFAESVFIPERQALEVV